jgi:hypothetical protein
MTMITLISHIVLSYAELNYIGTAQAARSRRGFSPWLISHYLCYILIS